VFSAISDIIFIIFLSLLIGGVGLLRMAVFTRVRPKIMIVIAVIAGLIFMVINIIVYVIK
jgi:hypothetical protein